MNILDAIGNTPLVEIKKIWNSPRVRIFAKVEGMNPGGSIKDRVALYMLQSAISSGRLRPGLTVLEATSGNTGIGLAMVCAVFGYPCILVMPDSVSRERVQICRSYGATIIIHQGDMDDAILHVEKMKRSVISVDCYYHPNQFDNPDNYRTHLNRTGPEITSQPGKNPTHFVSAIGTTGTIVGCSMWFKENYYRQPYNTICNTKIIAVLPPKDSKIPGLKNLQFAKIPEIYNPRLIDKMITVKDEDAFKMTKRLAREEGLFCGISSGAAMDIAVKVAQRLEGSANIVVILPDNGYRYLSEKIW